MAVTAMSTNYSTILQPSSELAAHYAKIQEKERSLIAGKYQLIKKLGDGDTSDVYLVHNVKTSEKYALKVYKGPNYLGPETEVLEAVANPNMVNLAECLPFLKFQKQVTSAILLQYAENGELYEYCTKGPFAESIVLFFFKQMLEALEVLHKEKGYAHLDLKPENILLDKDFNILLNDFGFAGKIRDKNGNKILETSYRVQNPYQPPQVWDTEVAFYRDDADLFALASILFILATGKPAFTRATRWDCYYRHVMNKDFDGFWQIQGEYPELSDNFKDLIFRMLSYDPKDRLTLAEFKLHPWLQGTAATPEEVRAEMTARQD